MPGQTVYPIRDYYLEEVLQLQSGRTLKTRFSQPVTKLVGEMDKQRTKTWHQQEHQQQHRGGGRWGTSSSSSQIHLQLNKFDADLVVRTVEYIIVSELESGMMGSSGSRHGGSSPAPASGPGAVLIFVPGWKELQEVVKGLETLHEDYTRDSRAGALGHHRGGYHDRDRRGGSRERSRGRHRDRDGRERDRDGHRGASGGGFREEFLILRLHSTVQKEEQRKVFDVPPGHSTRKIVVATNIAETSITIPDIVHVIDGGFHRTKCYCSTTNSSGLETVLIARSNVRQRRGRAGRCRSGNFFALYGRSTYEERMVQQEKPEMLRTAVEELVLQTRAMSCFDGSPAMSILEKAIAPPTKKSIRNALGLLFALGALRRSTASPGGPDVGQCEELTPLGRKLSKIPLHPTLARMLLLSDVFSKVASGSASDVFDRAARICIGVSNKSPLSRPLPFQEAAAARFREERSGQSLSDHILLANVYGDAASNRGSRGDYRGRGSGAPGVNRDFVDGATLEQNARLMDEMLTRVTDQRLEVLTFDDRGGAAPGTSAANGFSSGSLILRERVPHSDGRGGSESDWLLRALLGAGLPVAASDSPRYLKCLVNRVARCEPSKECVAGHVVSRLLGGSSKGDREQQNGAPAPTVFVAYFERAASQMVQVGGEAQAANKTIQTLRDCTLLADVLPVLLLNPLLHLRHRRHVYTSRPPKPGSGPAAAAAEFRERHGARGVLELAAKEPDLPHLQHAGGRSAPDRGGAAAGTSVHLAFPDERVAAGIMELRPRVLYLMQHVLEGNFTPRSKLAEHQRICADAVARLVELFRMQHDIQRADLDGSDRDRAPAGLSGPALRAVYGSSQTLWARRESR